MPQTFYRIKTSLVASATLALGLLLIDPTKSYADDSSPREHLEEATKKLLQTFELMLRAIPQYEAPEILENGDIIIRRKPSQNAPKPENATPPSDEKVKT